MQAPRRREMWTRACNGQWPSARWYDGFPLVRYMREVCVRRRGERYEREVSKRGDKIVPHACVLGSGHVPFTYTVENVMVWGVAVVQAGNCLPGVALV